MVPSIEDSLNIWKDIIIPLSLAVIGGGFSIWVFYLGVIRERKKDRKSEEKEKEVQKAERQKELAFLEKERQDKKRLNYFTLRYFAILTESTVKDLEKQVDRYKKHYEKLEAQPLEFHQLTTSSIEDLNRLLNKINPERLYQAYIEEKGDSDENITMMQKVFHGLDYFHLLLQEMKSTQERYIAELKENQHFSIKLAEDTMDLCADVCAELKLSYPDSYQKIPLFIDLNNLISAYYQKAKKVQEVQNLTIEFMHSEFTIPLEAIIQKYLDSEVGITIARSFKKAAAQYQIMLNRVQLATNEIKANHERATKVITELKTNSTALIEKSKYDISSYF